MLILRILWLLLLLETAPDDDDEADHEPDADEEELDENGEPIRDREAKVASMQDHINRLHKRIEERDARIKELEEGTEPADDSLVRVEAAFWRELATGQRRIADHESAWDLFTARGFADLVKVSDEGEVAGMDGALGKLIDRYPWLSDEPVTSDTDELRDRRRTAPPPRRKTGKSESGFSRAELQRRMPTLRKHR